MARLTVDAELLLITLLGDADLGADVIAATDVDTADRIPVIIVNAITGQMITNGAPALGWEWTVNLSIIEKGIGPASDLADLVYQTMHGFHDSQAGVEGVGYINHVADESMPRRTSTILTMDNLTQYDGMWTIRVRPDN